MDIPRSGIAGSYRSSNLTCFLTWQKELGIKLKYITKWEKIFLHNISDKGLISKIYKSFTKLNDNKENNIHHKMWSKDEQTLL